MSSSLLAKATQALKAKVEAGKRVREAHKAEEAILMQGLGQVGGGVAAGLLDAKFGKDGKPHQVAGIPTNAVVGLATALPALFIKKFPARAAVAAAGISQATCAGYRYIIDNVKPHDSAA
jgi:hypothetical protein